MKKILPIFIALSVSALLSALVTYRVVKPPAVQQADIKPGERRMLPGVTYQYTVQCCQDPEHQTPENIREIRAYSAPTKAKPEDRMIDGHRYTGAWNTLDTDYILFKYQDMNDLKAFNQRVRHPGQASFPKLFSGSPDPQELTRQKLTAIFERVKKLIDLKYAEKGKVKVLLFKDANQIHAEFHKIYGYYHPEIRAWYVFEYNTIYANVDDLNEGMLAHEMAHAVVDNYLKVRLPRELSEIIARYVDSNLMA